MKKHTGAKVLVDNRPGAGGLVGCALLYNAKPDGLTVGLNLMQGLVTSTMLKLDTVRFELDKFSYIGRIDVVYRVLFASKASGFKSIQDMQKSTKTIRFGVTGKASASAVDNAIISEAFGLKSKIIPGFKGSRGYMMAVIAGRELECACVSLAAFEDYVERGEVTMVAVQGEKRFPKYPHVPTVSETPNVTPEGKKLLQLLGDLGKAGRMLFAPPGLPEERRLFLEEALIKSLNEPALLEWAKKMGLNPAPLPGNESKALVDRLMGIIPEEERPRFKNILAEKYW
jgi:tripartite-type tricarboxylate transporter receptor subunit TctC